MSFYLWWRCDVWFLSLTLLTCFKIILLFLLLQFPNYSVGEVHLSVSLCIEASWCFSFLLAPRAFILPWLSVSMCWGVQGLQHNPWICSELFHFSPPNEPFSIEKHTHTCMHTLSLSLSSLYCCAYLTLQWADYPFLPTPAAPDPALKDSHCV